MTKYVDYFVRHRQGARAADIQIFCWHEVNLASEHALFARLCAWEAYTPCALELLARVVDPGERGTTEMAIFQKHFSNNQKDLRPTQPN